MALTVRGFAVELAVASATLSRRADEVTEKYAERIADGQRGMAPEGPTGDTKATISAVPDDEQPGQWLAGTETWYAHFVENGTSRLAPRPFIGPPADSVIPWYAAELADITADI